MPADAGITCMIIAFGKSEEYVSQHSLWMAFIFPKI